MSNLVYFAYGSNMNWAQLTRRCPSAQFQTWPKTTWRDGTKPKRCMTPTAMNSSRMCDIRSRTIRGAQECGLPAAYIDALRGRLGDFVAWRRRLR